MAPRKSTTKAKVEKEDSKAVKPAPAARAASTTKKASATAKAKPSAKAVEPKAKPAPTPEAKSAPKAKPAKAAKKALPAPPEPEAPKALGKASKAKPSKAAKQPETAVVPLAEPKPVETSKPAQPDSGASFPPQAAAILSALRDGRAVELIFIDADSYPPRTFEPRQLIFDTFTQAWFVWGWDRRYNAERHHRVDLLAEVNAVEGVGRAAQGPYKEGTPANHIGGWLGGEPIPVKALLMKQWIYAVKQAPAPFPQFKIEDMEEGKAQITFTATDLRAIARWCMQFGDGLQILEPQRLQDRIKQVGLAWGGRAAAQPSPAKPEPKPEPKAEPRPQPKREFRREHRNEPRPESRPEPRREFPEEKSDKPKAGKFEVRVERL